jgi:hypothetical protein
MRTASRTVAVALLLCAPAARAGDDSPGQPAPAGHHCFGEPRARWLADVTLAGALNPRGLELQLQLGRCQPLVTQPGLLWDYTNVQSGLTGYLSPTYAMPGAFLSIRPLSLLELRAEAELIQMWRIGLDGAGYFPLSGYRDDWSTLPASRARPAQGYTASLTANLQAELPLADGWSLLAADSASWQRWQLGGAGHYYNVRLDLPMARREWLLRNTAVMLVNRQLTGRVRLRFGITDDLTWVEGSGYRQEVLAGLLTAVIARWPGATGETQPFIRLGGYTAHAYRRGELQLVAGVSTTFDLAPRPTK